jgi:hypothetical protein
MDGLQPPLCLDDVLARLYESEINFSLSAFWDCGVTVKVGDRVNGFSAETDVRPPREAAEFLDRAAREQYPESLYALGSDEFERRQLDRLTPKVVPPAACVRSRLPALRLSQRVPGT